MREKLEALVVLRAILVELADSHERRALEQWISKRANWFGARTAYLAEVARLTEEGAKRDAAKAEMDFIDADLRAIETEIRRLDIAISEHDAKSGRSTLSQSLTSALQAGQRATIEFERMVDSVRSLQALSAMRDFGFDEFIPLISMLTRAATGASIERPTGGLLDAETQLIASDRTLVVKVDQARRDLIRKAEDERGRAQSLEERLRQHASGGSSIHLHEDTERLCLKLRQAGMSPRVLCNLIELSDVSWTAAAEGLLGRDRETVFVDRADIARATALFKDGRREFRRASLVSLNKLEPNGPGPRAGTFPALFKSDDRDAVAFIIRRHGTVRLADTIAQFNEPGRAIMKDGLYDDGLVRTHRAAEPSDFKIGKAAQAQAFCDLKDQAEQLSDAYAKSDGAAVVANLCRHTVSSPRTTPWRRATAEILAPSSKLSATIRAFSSAVADAAP